MQGVVRQFPAVNQSQEAAGNDAAHTAKFLRKMVTDWTSF
jgi:hypothetical protein